MSRTPIFCVILAIALVFALTSPVQAQVVPELFVTAARCMACHNGLLTATGENASIGTDWRASMMANSARDPYWQAAIRRETLAHPSASEAIQDECSACHMPMATAQARAAGDMGTVFDHLPVTHATAPRSMLAGDGVSCAMCHQIQEDNLGTRESFNAHVTLDTETAPGERLIYGPFEVDSGRQRLMRSASLYLPHKGTHLQTSELCATCHTLFTHALDDAGEVVGELPEQVPYLEWKHSAYAGSRSCQSCHMPEVAGEMVVSSVMGLPHANVSRHVFRGGNFFMPRVLNGLRLELGVAALPNELEATTRRTVDHLQSAAARIALDNVAVENGRLEATVTITNLAGHKLPSAYPSRRVWVRFTVRDQAGQVLFESGRLGPDGAVAGNDNDADASRFEPHHDLITGPDQVQIYESIMADAEGEITTVLLSGVRYAKDNRLLPDGFDKATAGPDIAVRGAAAGDRSFGDGGDRVRYQVEIGDAAAVVVEAELLYQPVGYRWAHNLADQQAPEIERFVAAFDRHAASSAVALARASASVEP
jgi:hypothetical protein